MVGTEPCQITQVLPGMLTCELASWRACSPSSLQLQNHPDLSWVCSKFTKFHCSKLQRRAKLEVCSLSSCRTRWSAKRQAVQGRCRLLKFGHSKADLQENVSCIDFEVFVGGSPFSGRFLHVGALTTSVFTRHVQSQSL